MHILCSINFTENRAFYEIMSKIYGGGREATDDTVIRRMCWISKVNARADTHTCRRILHAHAHTQIYGQNV